MPLVDQPFVDTFDLIRATPGEYTDASGLPATAPPDAPRFDHFADGAPRGLLIQAATETTAADRLTVATGDWAVPKGTVLHEYEDEDGQVVRRAWHVASDPEGVVDTCLNHVGRHRRIAYVPAYLLDRGGWVRWGPHRWLMGSILITEPGIALGPNQSQPFLEG